MTTIATDIIGKSGRRIIDSPSAFIFQKKLWSCVYVMMRECNSFESYDMTRKIRVGIIFGGKSAEHEVSLQSAKNIIAAIDREKYEPILIGIDKEGKWHLLGEDDFLSQENDPGKISLNVKSDRQVVLAPESQGEIVFLNTRKESVHIDVVFPILHGTFGEDGTIQGLLEIADIPFVGSGVLGSAVGMDKDVMKRLLRDAGIPQSKFLVCREKLVSSYEEVTKVLGTPIFVKPANAGSSVGVSKVRTEEEYAVAIREAFLYDQKIVIEENITGREIECAILGNESPIASVPGEVVLQSDFYSYEAKYIDAGSASIEIPAKLSNEKVIEIQALAIKTFQVLSCEGIGRVDMFLKENGDILVNEINTMPGFTKVSMYPKLFEASGIPYEELIDRLIGFALERFDKERRLKTAH